METVVIHPQTKEQLKAVKAFVKALNINFETVNSDSLYNPKFVDEVLASEQSAKDGDVIRVRNVNDIWADIL